MPFAKPRPGVRNRLVYAARQRRSLGDRIVAGNFIHDEQARTEDIGRWKTTSCF
jgi:hypothetical protein